MIDLRPLLSSAGIRRPALGPKRRTHPTQVCHSGSYETGRCGVVAQRAVRRGPEFPSRPVAGLPLAGNSPAHLWRPPLPLGPALASPPLVIPGAVFCACGCLPQRHTLDPWSLLRSRQDHVPAPCLRAPGNGQPCFEGTSTPIDVLFANLAAGERLDVILDHFPTIRREAAVAVLRESLRSSERAMVDAGVV